MLRKHTICLVSCLGQFYPPPFAWPFMQKLRASRARVWFQHKTSGLLHKFLVGHASLININQKLQPLCTRQLTI